MQALSSASSMLWQASMKSHDQIYTKNINIYNTDYNEYKKYIL